MIDVQTLIQNTWMIWLTFYRFWKGENIKDWRKEVHNKIQECIKNRSCVRNIRTLICQKEEKNFWLESSKLSCSKSLFKFILILLILVRVNYVSNKVDNTDFVIISIMKFVQGLVVRSCAEIMFRKLKQLRS